MYQIDWPIIKSVGLMSNLMAIMLWTIIHDKIAYRFRLVFKQSHNNNHNSELSNAQAYHFFVWRILLKDEKRTNFAAEK